VLINLISNAVEAMGQGKDRPRQLRIQSAGDSDVVQISVQDSGIGLDAEHLDLIFHSLFTTKEEGIGMGLSISRSIIEAHGGQLWAEPLPDGAVFHFRLPKAGGKQ
jgi:signal transduction histidine kinase